MQASNMCPDCASTNIGSASEQLICRDCGLIFESLPPTEPKKKSKTQKKR